MLNELKNMSEDEAIEHITFICRDIVEWLKRLLPPHFVELLIRLFIRFEGRNPLNPSRTTNDLAKFVLDVVLAMIAKGKTIEDMTKLFEEAEYVRPKLDEELVALSESLYNKLLGKYACGKEINIHMVQEYLDMPPVVRWIEFWVQANTPPGVLKRFLKDFTDIYNKAHELKGEYARDYMDVLYSTTLYWGLPEDDPLNRCLVLHIDVYPDIPKLEDLDVTKDEFLRWYNRQSSVYPYLDKLLPKPLNEILSSLPG